MAEALELTPQLFAEPGRQPSFAEFEAVDELLVDAFELTLSIFDKRRQMIETDPDLLKMESQLGGFFLELLAKGVLLHLPPEERRHLHANLTDDLRNRLQLVDPAGTGYGPDDIQYQRASQILPRQYERAESTIQQLWSWLILIAIFSLPV